MQVARDTTHRVEILGTLGPSGVNMFLFLVWRILEGVGVMRGTSPNRLVQQSFPAAGHGVQERTGPLRSQRIPPADGLETGSEKGLLLTPSPLVYST